MKSLSDLTHLSYSSISSYLYCPRSWRYHYLDDVVCVGTSPALVFGSAFHDAVEDFLYRRKAHDVLGDGVKPQELPDCWIDAWGKQLDENAEKGVKILFGAGEDSAESHHNKGYRMLSDADIVETVAKLDPLHGVWPGESAPTVWIEKQINLKVPGVPIPITGYIDLMASDGVPCDFKTAGKAWSHDQAMDESQPLFYLAALNQIGLNDNLLRFRHIVFVKTKNPYCQEFETQRNANEIFWLFQQIGEIWKAISAGCFPANNTGWKCSPKCCDFWDICKGK